MGGCTGGVGDAGEGVMVNKVSETVLKEGQQLINTTSVNKNCSHICQKD